MRQFASYALRLLGALLVVEGFGIVPFMTMLGLEWVEPFLDGKAGVALGLLTYFAGENLSRRRGY